MDNIEADDVIAHLSKQIFDESEVVISSTDKDFLQLINHRIKVYSPTKKKIYDRDAIYEEYGIPSKNFLTYRILEGDKSDNIPGVRGAGLKTIIKRFPKITDRDEPYYTLEECIKISDEKKDELKLYESVDICKEQLFLNRKLMQLFNVDITPSSKMKIMDLVESPITELIKFKFETKFVQDKLFTALPNLQGWLNQNFTQLNRYARMSHGKKS
jgi:5'-3' exonuclease